MERFEREVDPEGKLSPKERQRRASHARSAYFAALSLKAAKARREKREAREAVATKRAAARSRKGPS
jgi:hypothetical protein